MYLTSLRRSPPAANYIGRLREGLPLGKEYIGKVNRPFLPSICNNELPEGETPKVAGKAGITG
jgi:hypothetical protein